MALSRMGLSNTEWIATDAVSENQKTVHRQRVIVDGARDARLIGDDPKEAVTAALAWISGPQDAGDLQSLRVNGSSGTPGVFRYTVPAAPAEPKDLLITELALVGVDDGVIGAQTFFGAAALTNGLAIDLRSADGSSALLNVAAGPGAGGQTVIKRNADLVLAGWELSQPLAGVLVARWRPPYAEPVYLGAGQRIEVRVADNLTSLLELRFAVRGRLMTAGA
jgi:hypothetical protein